MSTFEARRKNLFNQLTEAEKQHDYSKSRQSDSRREMSSEIDRRTYKKIKGEMKHFRGRESIFKRPEAPLRHCLTRRTVPDYQKNPDKWTYYSLADVSLHDMSESTNTATALAILRTYEENENKKLMGEQEVECTFKKPVFKLSATLKEENQKEESNDIRFRSSKVIMPEYVVGVSKPKIKKERIKRENVEQNKAKLRLDHLLDDEE